MKLNKHIAMAWERLAEADEEFTTQTSNVLFDNLTVSCVGLILYNTLLSAVD